MKQYKVKMWVGSTVTEILVRAFNSSNAISIAKKIYPFAKVMGAISI